MPVVWSKRAAHAFTIAVMQFLLEVAAPGGEYNLSTNTVRSGSVRIWRQLEGFRGLPFVTDVTLGSLLDDEHVARECLGAGRGQVSGTTGDKEKAEACSHQPLGH